MNDKKQIIIYLHLKLFIFNIQHIASQNFSSHEKLICWKSLIFNNIIIYLMLITFWHLNDDDIYSQLVYLQHYMHILYYFNTIAKFV